MGRGDPRRYSHLKLLTQASRDFIDILTARTVRSKIETLNATFLERVKTLRGISTTRL